MDRFERAQVEYRKPASEGVTHSPIPFDRIVRYLRGGQVLQGDEWVDVPDRAAAIMAANFEAARLFAWLAKLMPIPLINPAHPHVEPLWRTFVKAELIDGADVAGIMALAATPGVDIVEVVGT